MRRPTNEQLFELVEGRGRARKKIDLLRLTRVTVRPHHCIGCRDNFYNGNNQYGIQCCWNMGSARLVRRKRVHINDIPPWRWQPVYTVPDCFRMAGYVHVRPTQEH